LFDLSSFVFITHAIIQGKETGLVNIYSHHINSFCNFVISAFDSRYLENYEVNFLFCVRYLVPGHHHIHTQFIPSNDIRVILSTGLPDVVDLDLRSRFSRAVNDVRWKEMCARGAMYCLIRLCDHRAYIPEFSDENMNSKKTGRRRNTPWKWRRTMNLVSHQPLTRPTFKTASSTSHNNDNANVVATTSDIHGERKLPATYLCLLKYLAYFLPRSSPYGPLIDACHNKTFAPMSRVFPRTSRRARREMSVYLSRNRGTAITL